MVEITSTIHPQPLASSQALALGLPPIVASDDAVRAVDTWLRLFGPTTLVAIHPETGAVQCVWLDETTRSLVVSWIRSHSRVGMNIYGHPNRPKPGLKKKAARTEIVELRCGAYADVDMKGGRSLADVWAAVAALPLQPSFVIFSGGGIQPVWLLDEPSEPTAENVARVERLSAEIAKRTGGDPVGNVDRILRLPFTQNHPNARKRAEGRVTTPSGLLILEGGL